MRQEDADATRDELHHDVDVLLDEVADVLGVPAGQSEPEMHHAMRGLSATLEADARPGSREVARRG